MAVNVLIHFLSNPYCDSMRPKVCNDNFMNVRLTLTAVNIDRKKCILFIVSMYIDTVSKIKITLKVMFEIKTSRCMQHSSGVFEDV